VRRTGNTGASVPADGAVGSGCGAGAASLRCLAAAAAAGVDMSSLASAGSAKPTQDSRRLNVFGRPQAQGLEKARWSLVGRERC
jgi:hypothetical protein